MVVLRKLVWIWAAVEFNVAGVNRVKGCVGYMLAVNAAAKLKKSLIHIYQLFSRDHKLDQTGGAANLDQKKQKSPDRCSLSKQECLQSSRTLFDNPCILKLRFAIVQVSG
jgi:hypothetical protein